MGLLLPWICNCNFHRKRTFWRDQGGGGGGGGDRCCDVLSCDFLRRRENSEVNSSEREVGKVVRRLEDVATLGR